MKMGFLLSMSGMISLVTSYILSIFISRYGGVAQVGLYNAGFSIINTYVGMIFAAMVTDYFPRLSAVASDNKKSAELINQQAEIGILIIAPGLNIFMVFINVVITILYSSKFLPISGMIQYVALGIFLKTVSWAMGYMMLAKGDSKIFFYSELLANIYILAINMICYRLYGLDGLGISFFVCYGLGILQGYIILHLKYQFRFDAAFYRIFFIQFLLIISCFLIVKFINGNLRYMLTLPVVCAAAIFSFKELNNKLHIIDFVKGKLNK
jgi:O-antigen/teichoic acid export membrane protein